MGEHKSLGKIKIEQKWNKWFGGESGAILKSFSFLKACVRILQIFDGIKCMFARHFQLWISLDTLFSPKILNSRLMKSRRAFSCIKSFIRTTKTSIQSKNRLIIRQTNKNLNAKKFKFQIQSYCSFFDNCSIM